MNNNLKKLVSLGIVAGCLCSSSLDANEYDMPRFLFGYSLLPTEIQEKAKEIFAVDERELDEVAFLSELNKEHRDLYRGLDREGQYLALEFANQPEYRGNCEGACQAVSRAVDYRRESGHRYSLHLLHNGMGRLDNYRGQY